MTKNQYGFTLTEILVAVMILGVLAVSFSSFFGFSVGSIVGAGRRQDALVEAQNLLERALVDDDFSGVDRQPATQNGIEGELITATVIWRDGMSGNRELKLSVFKAKEVF